MRVIVPISFNFVMFGTPMKIRTIIKYPQINPEDSFINTEGPIFVICRVQDITSCMRLKPKNLSMEGSGHPWGLLA